MHKALSDPRELPAPGATLDVAVVGSGPGGSLAAALLAESGRSVAVLEEGPWFGPEDVEPYSARELRLKYRQAGILPTSGRARVACAEARCVGGGSELNSGFYHRTPPEVLAEWRERLAVRSLSEADLEPHFRAVEADLGIERPEGPDPGSPGDRLRQGARALGWRSAEAARWVSPGPSGRRSMTRTYLPRLLQAGGRLIPEARVLRLRRRGDAWVLSGTRSGSAFDLRARHVVAAAGAIRTPDLLRRNGLSSTAGREFRLHPMVKVVAAFDGPLQRGALGIDGHQVLEFSPRLGLGCSVSTPAHLSLALQDYPELRGRLDAEAPRLAAFYAMTRGGRGAVRPGGFDDAPDVSYSLDPAERDELGEALRLLCRCLLAAGASRVYPALGEAVPIASEADLGRLPRSVGPAAPLFSVHLFASCPLGEKPGVSVVDSFGRLPGVPGLQVADASLLGGPPGVNPQGSLLALVRRNVLRFLEENPRA